MSLRVDVDLLLEYVRPEWTVTYIKQPTGYAPLIYDAEVEFQEHQMFLEVWEGAWKLHRSGIQDISCSAVREDRPCNWCEKQFGDAWYMKNLTEAIKDVKFK